MAHLRDDDCIASTHRGHGHCIAKGVDVHGMMAEIYGKKTGVCQGKGGSMHIADLEKGMLGANGIVGAVDGFDFFAVHEAAGAAIERARAGEGPSLIEVKLTRYYGHFEGDAQTYRDPDEVKHYRETRDCLKQFRERTCHAGLLSASDLDAIDAEVEARIEDAVQRAKNDPKPEPDDLLRDVYVSYP